MFNAWKKVKIFSQQIGLMAIYHGKQVKNHLKTNPRLTNWFPYQIHQKCLKHQRFFELGWRNGHTIIQEYLDACLPFGMTRFLPPEFRLGSGIVVQCWIPSYSFWPSNHGFPENGSMWLDDRLKTPLFVDVSSLLRTSGNLLGMQLAIINIWLAVFCHPSEKNMLVKLDHLPRDQDKTKNQNHHLWVDTEFPNQCMVILRYIPQNNDHDRL